MQRFLRTASAVALTVAAVSAVAGAAQAQTYNRLVVFGDSLSDNGNLYALTLGAQPPQPPYFQGRVSNGPVFTELLGFNAVRYTAGAPVTGSINYAVSGARTDNSIFNPFAVPPTVPGMRTQLATYTGAGGVFGPTDLVSILGGANNIFQGLGAAAISPNPTGSITPVANGAAADINFIVNSVATAGAGTILVVNLPKLSLTPQFRTSPAAPLADFAVNTFNTALATGLTATAAARPGSNIILMDLFKIGDTIAGNPGAFGISNVTDPCFNGATVCANPDSYFYFDGVHPTAAGHRILAALANDYLYYGQRAAYSAVQGETAYRHREDMADAATEALSGRADWSTGTAVSFGGTLDRTETDARGAVGESEAETYGVRVGLEHSTSANWRVSLAGSARVGEVTGAGQSFDVESFGLDAALGWRSGGTFAGVSAGVSGDSFDDIRRAAGVGPVTLSGQTQGVSTSVRGVAGVWFDMGGVAVSPRVGVSWVSADIDGYVEQGAAAQYAYADRTFETVTADIAIRAEGDMGGFGFHVEGGYREELDDSSEGVGARIQNSPSQAVFTDVESPFGSQLTASVGVQRDFGPVLMAIGYKGRFSDAATSHMGGVTFTLPLQ